MLPYKIQNMQVTASSLIFFFFFLSQKQNVEKSLTTWEAIPLSGRSHYNQKHKVNEVLNSFKIFLHSLCFLSLLLRRA